MSPMLQQKSDMLLASKHDGKLENSPNPGVISLVKLENAFCTMCFNLGGTLPTLVGQMQEVSGNPPSRCHSISHRILSQSTLRFLAKKRHVIVEGFGESYK